MQNRPDSSATPTTRRVAAVAALVAALGVAGSGFLSWLVITDSSGRLTLSGWGRLGGYSELAGTDINDLLDSLGSSSVYRPVQFVAALMAFAILAAAVLFVRVSRFAAATLVAVGAWATGWGLFRAIRLGDIADVLIGDSEDGVPLADAAAGAGPYVCAAGGLVLIVIGVLALLGRFGAAPARD